MSDIFNGLFNFLIDTIATLIQIVLLPINLIVNELFPDFTSNIISMFASIDSFLDTLGWSLSLIPSPLLATIIFIFTIEIIRLTVYISSHTLVRAWNLIQKIKFW